MRFIILFTDNPNADPDIRPKYMADHLAFLQSHADSIQSAGPLSTPGGAGAGGLWVVDADTAQAVETLICQDPFWPTGLRQSYDIFRWTQVFADGERRI